MSNYIEMHNKSGLKEGDEVIVTRSANNYEQGWKNTWESGMDFFIGETGVIYKDRGGIGFSVVFGNSQCRFYKFPYFVLEKVERKPEFNDVIQVLTCLGWEERHVAMILPNGEAMCFTNGKPYPLDINSSTWTKWRLIDKPTDNEWAKYTF